MYKYLFGPVPSRRLGISLGVDLVPLKTCNYNCVYCECGATKEFSIERKKYVELDKLKEEIIHALEKYNPDYITFSGGGEPTLNSDLGEIIKWIKDNYKIKTALITNSSLLYLDEVIEEVKIFDVIMPSLNAVDEVTFKKINRSAPNLTAELAKLGLKKLSDNFHGETYIEFFIIEGLNDSEEELDEYIKFLKTIKYTKLQLNSLARVGAEPWVKPVSQKRMDEIKNKFEMAGVPVQIISSIHEVSQKIEKDEELFENMKTKRIYSDEEIQAIYKK